MIIRKAEEKDIPRILELLGQVLQIHADIRPDIFTKFNSKMKFLYVRRRSCSQFSSTTAKFRSAAYISQII